jgi:hypothetical protein
MKKRQEDEGRFSDHGRGLGTVTEKMVMARARELALINGRSSKQVIESDLDQARRELIGEETLNPETPAEELIPEEDRWHEVAEGAAKEATTMEASDEQTFAEKLVEEGMEDAEQDQMVQAVRESIRKEKS